MACPAKRACQFVRPIIPARPLDFDVLPDKIAGERGLSLVFSCATAIAAVARFVGRGPFARGQLISMAVRHGGGRLKSVRAVNSPSPARFKYKQVPLVGFGFSRRYTVDRLLPS